MVEQKRMARIIDAPVAQTGATLLELMQKYTTMSEQADVVRGCALVVTLAQQVAEAGGRLFVVGGAVRDEILRRVPQDIDVEIHGLEQDAVEALLRPLGMNTMTGKSFGTYKLPVGNITIEAALPRTDSQYGEAHAAVEVKIHPWLGLTAAARRREFTIGAIYKDPLTGEMFDPFHGLSDLEARTLRHVDDATFPDDALRVLRGAGQAARFSLTVAPTTLRLMRTMVEKMGALSKERLYKEWTRLLLLAEAPSTGIVLLKDVGVLDRWYPELGVLWNTEQDVRLHPEGTVGRHTGLVVDSAAQLLRHQSFATSERTELLFAALLHDTGKATTTRRVGDQIQSPNYQVASVALGQTFLHRLGVPPTVIRRIGLLIAHHVRPATIYQERDSVTDFALRVLAHDIGHTHLRTLLLLTEADYCGRGPFTTSDGLLAPADTAQFRQWWESAIRRLKLDQVPEQLLSGHDLVEQFGWRPGPAIGEMVRLAEELAMHDWTRERILQIVAEAKDAEQAVEVFRQHTQQELADLPRR